jgi:hypothetical protein
MDDTGANDERGRDRYLCDDCGRSPTGEDLTIPYEGERVLFFVTVCGCGINIELLRQLTDADEIPCIFCDKIGTEGLPWITHTHETTKQIW